MNSATDFALAPSVNLTYGRHYLSHTWYWTWHIVSINYDIRYNSEIGPTPKWRHLSYHVEYDSLVKRWANTGSLPAGLMIV